MKASTTIENTFARNKIFVPSYQRAYSWETELDKTKVPKQVNVFLSDLEAYNRSTTKSKYYFGHFLFEEISENHFGVIDGQQRLTTITIFLSALFSRLKVIRELTERENEITEDILKRNSTYRFSTVDYDNQLFRDYVIDQKKTDKNGLETISAKRIVKAFDYFKKQLSNKDENYLIKMLETVQNSSCTTHPVKDESEAIQMFIFQNNRGKKPSNLEIIKAQFMFYIHLYGGNEKEELIEEIKSRFEKIYKSISSIEYNINEDDVLLYTMRIYFNSLWESNALDKINKLLENDGEVIFIKEFTYSLSTSFEHLTTFFGKDEKESLPIHSLITLGGIGIAIPFIIKAYTFNLERNEIEELCKSLESLVLRHRLIGTTAYITSRIDDVYKSFTKDNISIEPIVKRIEWMKTRTDYHWGHWNNDKLENALQGEIKHPIARFLLWKYENHLESIGKSGYTQSRYDKIKRPELEHIAPQTDNPESGYDVYDDEFVREYLNCLGNYLLISKPHNGWASNRPFKEKLDSYNHSAQQREIIKMTIGNPMWSRQLINDRKNKITKFLIETL
jgi:hypothetical protein